MLPRSRREFLADVGRGVLVAGIGSGLASQLGLAPALADEPPDRLTFGDLEPLVALVQETPPDRLLPVLADKLRQGTELRSLVAAAALANARTFGGEDYVGFHTMMALAPAFHMAGELPPERRPLPVFKVLFRNSNRIQEKVPKEEVLHAVKPGKPGDALPEALVAAVHRKDVAAAEQAFLLGARSPEDALNFLLPAVQENQEVHRVVMPYRAWDLLPIVGREHALTLLRQSVHYCVHNENERYYAYGAEARTVLPKLLEQYGLPRKEPGRREADDAWVEKLSTAIFSSKPADAAEAAAAALADGFGVDAIGEALALATNQLLLRDDGRPKEQAQPDKGKPVGSVHGDSIGVHACDSANAWRNLARVSNPRNAAACLILGAYQAANDRTNRGGDFLKWEPYPRAEARALIRTTDKDRLLDEAEAAIKDRDQARASAAVAAYGAHGYPERPVFDLLLRYSISEDGALHAEKYYRTASEEFAAGRQAFRWRHLISLARVVASAYGQPAPGHAEACKLLKV